MPWIPRRLATQFWVIPGACGVAAVLLAWALVRVDSAVGDRFTAFLFPGPPEGARSFLGAVITAMISFTGLVFSITVVVLVLTSGQFSPRVLRQFIRDRTIQWSLGLFVATFLFAMTTLREVQGTDETGPFVPRISVTVSFLLVLAAVAMFVHYINHVVHMIQVSSIIDSIGAETRSLIDGRCPVDPPPDAPEPILIGPAETVTAPRPGMVTVVQAGALTRRAETDGVVVVLALRVGEFVPAGAPLMTVHGRPADATGELDEAGYAASVGLDVERSMDQDIAFGFRQLVDIAVKALSPSVNDPTTASQATDVLHDLLRRLVVRPTRPGRYADTTGATRLVVPVREVEDLLEEVLGEIWQFGSGSPQIPGRLRHMLVDLLAATRPEYRPALARWHATVTVH